MDRKRVKVEGGLIPIHDNEDEDDAHFFLLLQAIPVPTRA
jgi:hypothetical protein